MGDDENPLIIRGGLMARENVLQNIADVLGEFDRPGLCVKAIDRSETIDLAGPAVVSNTRFCLTLPSLLREAGLDPALLDPTHDLGDRFQHTLWLPDEPADTLVEMLWAAFRGPIPKGGTSNDWRTEDLRRLHHPGP